MKTIFTTAYSTLLVFCLFGQTENANTKEEIPSGYVKEHLKSSQTETKTEIKQEETKVGNIRYLNIPVYDARNRKKTEKRPVELKAK